MPILAVSHDFAHPVRDDEAWSESYWFGAYDPPSESGFLARIAVRPNAGTMDGWLNLWLPGRRLGHVITVRGQSTMIDRRLDVGGLVLECLVPMQRWRVSYEGPGEIRDLVRRDAPAQPATLAVDAVFDALTPAIGAAGRPRDDAAPAEDTRAVVSLGHFEQAGRWAGHITVDGTRRDFTDARGMRDKSWGPRRWDRVQMWRWFAVNFGDDVHLGGVRVRTGDTPDLHRGWLWRDGTYRSIRGWDLRTTMDEDGVHQRHTHAVITDKHGDRHEIRGEMLAVAEPELHDSFSGATGRTVLHLGLARWEYEDRVGYGLVEYAHHYDVNGHLAVAVE